MDINPLYFPREDSYLLAKSVEELSKGRVFEMGTGSGFLSKIAIKNSNVESVLAVDINSSAIVHAKKRNHDPRISYMKSDLYSNVKGKFDTIIFNPPYLPDDPNIRDVALDGGKKGYELSVKFLIESRNHLKRDGTILFLFSSLTKKNIIDKTLIENGYIFTEIDNLDLSFEQLYVYEIKKVESLNEKISSINYLTSGKRGIIYKGIYDNKNIALKIKNPSSTAIARIFIEGENLKKINLHGIGPRHIKSDDKYLIYEYVEGVLFPQFVRFSTKNKIIEVIKNVFNQLYILDKDNIQKEEMTNPYKHIVVQKDLTPVLLDFERASKRIKPNNVNQFCQYIISSIMTIMLNEKKIQIEKEKILVLAKKYKKDYSEVLLNEIMACIN